MESTMQELRRDPLQKHWVIVASGRGARPTDFGSSPEPESADTCPFCEGHESETPPELYADREEGLQPDGPGWRLRVVPNKFPALRMKGWLDYREIGVFGAMDGVGEHELIIETPAHRIGLADLDHDQIRRIVSVFRQRIIEKKKNPKFQYVLVFKNHGVAAGASLSHSHTQVIALPVMPQTVTMELDAGEAYFNDKRRCLMCDLIAQEIDAGERIIRDGDGFVAIAPYASRFPFECWIVPKVHACAFELITGEDVSRLATMLKDVLLLLKNGLQDPPFNMILHTSPNVKAQPEGSPAWQSLEHHFHWHIEIMPRLTRIAGFEWGTGFYINSMPPEEAARFLRKVEV
jgi:UDPglucose--hexose-1-phosphate uridylyltransferase